MVRKKAFTLVELLVVISIIALLLAVLMPALNKAREQGKAIVCSNRLHQLGLACQLYLNKYNNKFFPSYADPQQAWASSAQGYELQRSAGTKVGFYTGSIYDCPSQRSRDYTARLKMMPDFIKYLDYAYNGCIGDGDISSTVRPAPKAKLSRPSSTVMFWDSTRYRGYPWPTFSWGINPDYWNNKNAGSFHTSMAFMQWPHSKAANFMFVDGHVEKANEKTVKDAWFNPGF
ncbi:MAG: hypothetical protein A2Y12_02405 [Planctomycetes bacterium GWF2_42_9]|nr:MAG: hypothetical protein A2Y12_02405 [Planctomycetes bacterium GWF2_42_9]